MKRIISILIILTFSFLAYGKVLKLSKNEFLKLYDNGKIQFDIMPTIQNEINQKLNLINNSKGKQLPLEVLLQIEKEMIKDYEAQYSYFQKEMAYTRYIDDGPWRYFISFDYATTRKCTFRVSKINPECGNVLCFNDIKNKDFDKESFKKNPDIDHDGVIIDDKYCEKIYGIKIKNRR